MNRAGQRLRRSEKSPLRTRSQREDAPGFRRQAAFTMVEIALCLAIIAFAMVAIIGVLPTGLRVQKENREETIINQEGTFLLEAIRSGSRSLDDLTNYVDAITISNATTGARATYTRGSSPNSLNTGARIIGLLSTPKHVVTYAHTSFGLEPLSTNTNVVMARLRAINGAAAEKTPSTNDDDLVFSYLLTSELVSLSPAYASVRGQVDYTEPLLTSEQRLARSNLWVRARTHQSNHHELRLTLQYPLIAGASRASTVVGNNQKTFRTIINGRLVSSNDVALGRTLYFLEPLTFAQVTNVVVPKF